MEENTQNSVITEFLTMKIKIFFEPFQEGNLILQLKILLQYIYNTLTFYLHITLLELIVIHYC
jgi:hypothetical protein